MKIAIHHKKQGFSEHWIKYCQQNKISYKIVNCYDSDIIQQLEDCDALMWHHHHANHTDTIFAKSLLFSLQFSNKKVFPDFNTSWHFDDKIAQKYLFESLGLPCIKTHIFYTKKETLNWLEKTTFPKVFKLRGGAGSANVKLIQSKSEAKKIVNKAFGKGFDQFDRFNYFRDTIRKYKLNKVNKIDVFKAFARIFISTSFAKLKGNEKGYVYFQDFIPDNDCDIRIVVIANKAYGFKRMVRENDFRASGSGDIHFNSSEIPLSAIQLAIDTAKILKTQCTAFDFIFDTDGKPLIVEVSFGFSPLGRDNTVGYWDADLNFHSGVFNQYGWMVENILAQTN